MTHVLAIARLATYLAVAPLLWLAIIVAVLWLWRWA